MANFVYFENKECEYYPCHAGQEELNCLFCYCPLYALADRCGGNFTYTPDGIKDCSACVFPHRRENYGRIMEKMPMVAEIAKKKPEKTEST